MLGWLKWFFISSSVNIFSPFSPFLSTCPTNITNSCLFLASYLTLIRLWRLPHLGHVFRCKFFSFILLKLCEETTTVEINTRKWKSKREENIWKYKNRYKREVRDKLCTDGLVLVWRRERNTDFCWFIWPKTIIWMIELPGLEFYRAHIYWYLSHLLWANRVSP